MANLEESLKSRYKVEHRYANFGAVLRSIRVSGFRGIKDVTLEFSHPVTAISGLNGCGKSTFSQLAVSGYKLPSTAGPGYSRYFVYDFFPVSIADPQPFDKDASIVYSYETTDPEKPREVTVSRGSSKWSGYKRQPERFCEYIGLTFYLPKVERRDLTVYRVKDLELRKKCMPSAETRAKVAEILKQPYQDIHFQTVGHKEQESELGIVERFGSRYSENNMGFGEGRILYLVDKMENAPNQSLFVLEEPETSLHQDARGRLVRYFLDVSNRKGHQIIFSTHSSTMLRLLGPESRIMLTRGSAGVEAVPGLSHSQISALLSDGAAKTFSVCVEDDFAKQVLEKCILRVNPFILRAISIVAIGDANEVAKAVRFGRKLGLKIIGLRDADQTEVAPEGLFRLPGNLSPEKEAFNSQSVVQYLSQEYSCDLLGFLQTLADQDHHHYCHHLAEHLGITESTLEAEVVKAYVRGIDIEEATAVVGRITHSMS